MLGLSGQPNLGLGRLGGIDGVESDSTSIWIRCRISRRAHLSLRDPPVTIRSAAKNSGPLARLEPSRGMPTDAGSAERLRLPGIDPARFVASDVIG